jgi:pyruvate ferredoxin oxidoreductase delta subunit
MQRGAAEDQIAQSKPSIGEAGATGDWRNKHPVIAPGACLAARKGIETCQLCWVYCPDACIARGIPPTIELTYCKGCGICAAQCPADAIEMVPEAEHGVCEM